MWRGTYKRVNPKGKAGKFKNVAVMLFAFIAGTGFAHTWPSGIITIPLRAISDPGFRAGVAAFLVIAALIAAIGDIAFDKKADKLAQMASFVLATLLLEIAGTFMGVSADGVIGFVYSEAGSLFSEIGGR